MHTLKQFLMALALATLLLPAPPALAQGEGENTVWIEFEAGSSFAPGELVVVLVAADTSDPALGFGFQLRYDPRYLEIIERPDSDGESGPGLVQGGLFSGSQRVMNRVGPDGDGQLVDLVYTYLGADNPGTQGRGTIASVAFRVVQAGNTAIALENPRLIGWENNAAVDLPLTMTNVVLNVIGDASAPVATPLSAPGMQQLTEVVAPSQPEEPIRWGIVIPILIVAVVCGVLAVVLLSRYRKDSRQRSLD